jgi:acyl-CoA reductase-like NAD-dependent aldehyde dehydrogenase
MKAKIFIGSKELDKKEVINRINPFTKKIVSQAVMTTTNDLQIALKIAKKAFINTKKSLLSQRINWLRDVAYKLKEQKEDFAKTITDEVNKPIAFSRVEVDRCIETIELSISAAIELSGETINTDATNSGKKTLSFYKREPIGVVGCITPFNFPLNLVAHKLAPAIVMGNSVVLKPTPEAPLTAYKFVKLFIDSQYAIEDAISLVYGDAQIGSQLVKSDIVNKISFTGSVPVGNIITKNAGIKKLSLELGGNAATFIDKSANIQLSAQRCAFGAFINSGQVCISLQRIYVHKDIYEEFALSLKEETLKLKVGNPYEDDTFIGPLINEDAVNRAYNWCQSAINEGARVICGNKADGLNFYPTIMADVTDDMKIVCEEVFAPIVSLVKVDSYEEAILKMNDSPYGLQFSIFTNDLQLTQRFIDDAQCGGVVINDIPTLRFDIQPYGGVKLSGIGREGPKFAIQEFSEIKSIVIM